MPALRRRRRRRRSRRRKRGRRMRRKTRRGRTRRSSSYFLGVGVWMREECVNVSVFWGFTS